ncbi:MAG: tetratricopeptide repeat protein [Cyanothece sp. SIO2G6]|nr:tetratricopeptide repeat protein [Cyanothece sp. SIO2G6]
MAERPQNGQTQSPGTHYITHSDASSFGPLGWWNPELTEVLNDLLRALRRKKGFGLFFVQCSPAQADKIIKAIQERFPQKRLEQFELNRDSETLYEELLEEYQINSYDVACVTGVEQTLYSYEDTKRLAGWTAAEILSYSWKGLPPLLGHLNRQRETFATHLPIALIFFVPRFVIDYFVQRAPDFFDWRSGLFKFSEDSETLKKASQDLTNDQYDACTSLTDEERLEKIFKIKDIIFQLSELDYVQKSNLLRQQGRLFHSGYDFEQALDCYDRALESNSADYISWNNRAAILLVFELYGEAIESLENAIKIKSDYPSAWNNKGLVLAGLQRYEEAIESYNHSISINPNYYNAWINQGIALKYLGRYKESIECYKKALEIHPDEFFPWIEKGKALFSLECYQDSLKSLDKALEINESSFAWSMRGYILTRVGLLHEALKSYRKALEINPDYFRAWLEQSYVFSKEKRYEEALSSVENALNIRPYETWAWHERATYQEKLGLYDEALESYNKISELRSDNMWDWYYYAYGFYYSGQYRIAIDGFNKAIELKEATYLDQSSWSAWFIGVKVSYQSNPSYLFYYGKFISYLKLGKIETALFSLKKSLLSTHLYRDFWKLVTTVLVAGSQGRLRYQDLSSTFDFWVRHFGIKR